MSSGVRFVDSVWWQGDEVMVGVFVDGVVSWWVMEMVLHVGVVVLGGDDVVATVEESGVEWWLVWWGGRSGGDAMIGGGVHRLWQPKVSPEMGDSGRKTWPEKGEAPETYERGVMQRVRTFEKQYPQNKVQQMGGDRGRAYAIDGEICGGGSGDEGGGVFVGVVVLMMEMVLLVGVVVLGGADVVATEEESGVEWWLVWWGGRSGGDAMIGGGVHRLWRPEVSPGMETASGKLGRKKGGAGNLWREECVFMIFIYVVVVDEDGKISKLA
ncbi:hypothetical protein Tco_1210993 [Tanacetum coccineum]